jgi:hypothetical protein
MVNTLVAALAGCFQRIVGWHDHNLWQYRVFLLSV